MTQVGAGIRLLAVGLLAIVIAACNVSIIGVRGSGQITTEARPVESFSEIDLRGSGTVLLELGDEESLTIEADDNLLEYLTTEVEGSTLILDANESISPTEDIVYRITATTIEGLRLSGSGEFDASDLGGDTLNLDLDGSGDIVVKGSEWRTVFVRLSGSGEITMSGSTDGLEVNLDGSGSFDGEDLLASEGDVSVAGSGDVTVNVSTRLTAEISGSGDIVYLGSPQLSSEIDGSGSIRQR